MTTSTSSIPSPDQSPGFLLWQTSSLWQKQIKNVLDPHQITHTQFVLMSLVLWCKSNGYTPNQRLLCELSMLDKMTVSKALSGIEALKLITREQDASDTRSNVIALTPDGDTLVRTLVPALERIDTDFFACASRWEMRDMVRVFREITGNDA
ncbi:MAG: MarR family transcriptional regulator [Candidatus Puniceispirillum sp.]|nr:MarR family transcriptional regulator [Candidatus Puniceispirillum sp.]